MAVEVDNWKCRYVGEVPSVTLMCAKIVTLKTLIPRNVVVYFHGYQCVRGL